MHFRLHGLIPVVHSSGPDIARSGAGRLAAETVAWLPQALVPQSGAQWTPIDQHRAIVTLAHPGGTSNVEVTVDDQGRLRSAGLDRWNGSTKPPRLEPFGGEFDDEFVTPDGVRLADRCRVGWGWNTDGWATGQFFTARLDSALSPCARPAPSSSAAPQRCEHPGAGRPSLRSGTPAEVGQRGRHLLVHPRMADQQVGQPRVGAVVAQR